MTDKTESYDMILNLYGDTITLNDIERMKKYKTVHIINENFNDDLNLIPSNVTKLLLDAKSLRCSNIPQHITHLNIVNLNSLVIISSNLIELTIGHDYFNSYPNILGLLPYNIKKITINFPYYDNNYYINLNTLPDSIKFIDLFFWLCESQINLNINKLYPNLRHINFYDANLSNLDEINLYTKKYNIDTTWVKLNDYLRRY